MYFDSKIKRNMSFIVKNTTQTSLLDYIAPLTCRGCGALGSALCECCKNNIIKNRKATKLDSRVPELPPIYVVDSRKNLIGTLIHDYKYNSVRALAPILAKLMDSIVPELSGNVSIIPLPTISKHVRERGFDHTLKIAKLLKRYRGQNYKVQKLLLRNKNTVQVGADKTARIAQAKTAYCINPKIPIDKNTTYLLFDDVWTTGASLKEATKKLREAGAQKIIIAVLAVS